MICTVMNFDSLSWGNIRKRYYIGVSIVTQHAHYNKVIYINCHMYTGTSLEIQAKTNIRY